MSKWGQSYTAVSSFALYGGGKRETAKTPALDLPGPFVGESLQDAALAALLWNRSVADAARSVGLRTATLYRMLEEDADFIARWRATRKRLNDACWNQRSTDALHGRA